MLSLNTTIFFYINKFAGNWYFLDLFFIFLTKHIFYSIFLLVGFYILFYKPFAVEKVKRINALWGGLYIVFSVFITFIITYIIKFAVRFPRPFEVLTDINVLAPIAGGTSFPSAHSSLTMALAIATYQYYPRLGVLLIIISLAIGFSRIFVGVHYPLDVLVGFLIGILVPILIKRFF